MRQAKLELITRTEIEREINPNAHVHILVNSTTFASCLPVHIDNSDYEYASEKQWPRIIDN